MNATRIFAAMLCVVMLGTAGALAQRSNPCDPRYHFITPADCTSVAEQAGKHLGELRQAIAEENIRIAAARKRFWETYPDKPGAAEARDEFGKRLFGKDYHYLYLTLTETLGGVKSVDKIGGKLDGGIPQIASFEFRDWVEEVRSHLGERSITDLMLTDPLGTPERLRKAMAASEKKHDVYQFERDWAEFDAVGREPVGLDDPALYFPALCLRWQKIGWDEALAEYAGIVKALGKDNVLRAIQQVHAAPKIRFGVLKVTTPEPFKTGPGGSKIDDDSVPMPEGVIGVTAGAIRAVERLATQGDDRRYLLWLLTEENRPGGGSHIDQATKWQYAETTYQRLVLAFGEPDVLQAARLVRTATKRATSGDVMDSRAIGATRGVPFASFQDIIARKNPRGYVRNALILSEKLDFPAAVDAAYKKFISENDEQEVLDAAKKMAAGRPNLIYRGELKTLEEALELPSEPKMPAETLVDFPEYVGWKKLAPRAKVTYARRIWLSDRPGTDHLAVGYMDYRQAYLLRSANDDQVQLWFTETSFDHGNPRQPHDTEIAYPAKSPPITGESNTMLSRLFPSRYARVEATKKETGSETIAVNGRALATRWESVTGPSGDCTLTTKIWTSDEIPTQLIRRTEDQICLRGSQVISRSIRETYLESFEGFTPGTAGTATTEYVPPPTPGNGTVASEAVPTPALKPAPAQPTSAPTRRTPPPPPPRVPTPTGLPPEAAAQFELAQRFNAVMARATNDKRELAQLEKTQAGQVPADIRAARDRLDGQLKTILMAMTKRDNAQTAQALQSAEDSVTVIEKYLGQ